MRTTQLFFVVAAAAAVHAADTSASLTTSAESITSTPEQSDGLSSAYSKMESIAEANNIESAIETAYSSWDAEFWKTQTAIANDAETGKALTAKYAIEGTEAKLDLVEKNDKIDEEVQKSYVEAAQEYIDILKEASGAARVGSVGVLAGVLVSALVAVAAGRKCDN